MLSSLREVCKLGIVHFMLHKDTIKGDGDHASLLKLLESPDFDAVETTWINDPEVRRSVVEKRRSTGKSLAFGAQPILLTQKHDLNSLDEERRRAAVRAVRDVVPQAYELEASGFGVLSGKTVDPSDHDRAMSQLVKSLVEIADTLAESGTMPLVIETFDQLDYGKNCLIGPNLDAARVAKEVRREHPNFGVMIDLSHLPLQKETAQQAWDAVGEYVVHAHMGNCVMEKPEHPMNGDEHPPLCDPDGENCVEELAEYLRVLKSAGFLNRETRPFLSFEVVPYNGKRADEVVRMSLQTLSQAWERV